MAKRGRKPKRPEERKTAQLSIRLTPALRARLEEARRATGLAITQEIESRLRRSFELDREIQERFGGPRSYWLFRIIAEDIRAIETIAGGKWFESRFAYEEIESYLEVVLGRLRRPRGRYGPPKHLRSERHFPPGAWGRGMARQRLFTLEMGLRDPEGADRLPRPPWAVDPVVASGPFAGKLANPSRSERRRRERLRKIAAETEHRKGDRNGER